MRILTAAIVRKKLKKKNLSMDIRRRVLGRISYLKNLTDERHVDLIEYLIKKNAKKLKGTTSNHIFKFKLDEANRLAFTYGKYLCKVRPEYKDALIILDCLKHDEQDDFDPLFQESDYLELQDLGDFKEFSSDIGVTTLEDIEEMGIADLDDLQIWDYYFDVQAMYVLNDDELFDVDTETLDVCLSDEQDGFVKAYQRDPKPTLILGGAGTGKTLMTIHMLHQFKNKNFEAKCLYVTQSKALLRVAEERYEKISDASELMQLFEEENIPPVRFENITEYCMRALGVKYTDLVSYDTFVSEFVGTSIGLLERLQKYQIQLFDLWAEIRGTIKGGLGEYWNRVGWFDQQQLGCSPTALKELEQREIIYRKSTKISEQKKFRLNERVLQTPEKYRDSLSEGTKDVFDLLYKESISVDPQIYAMDKQTYLSLKEENSTLEKEKREFIYKVCCEYQAWLKNGKFDDNDLVLRMLEEGKIETYDFIVVDEVQDYTELQIYMLEKMLKNPNHIILAGDSHQIINPTMFREERILKLFGKDQLQIRRLTRNYRCQENIVAYGNALSKLRQEYVAMMGNEEEEYSKRKGEVPFVLEYSEENVKALLRELKDCPNVAILVPDEVVKSRVKGFLGEDGENIRIISTVAEIKGMEYRYVVCYNLIGYYHEVWKEIFAQKSNNQKKNRYTKYRYYFNLMYVGVSRAQNFLCIINEHDVEQYERLLMQNMSVQLRRLKTFDYQKLMLHTLDRSDEAWLEFAESAMDKGDYENAMTYLQRAGASREKIWRCQMYILMDKYLYEDALRYAIILQDERSARTCCRNCEGEPDIVRLAEFWLKKTKITRKKGFSADTIADWIRQEFIEFEEAIQEQVMFMYMRIMAKTMFEQLGVVKEMD